jgi:hypothetical protein
MALGKKMSAGRATTHYKITAIKYSRKERQMVEIPRWRKIHWGKFGAIVAFMVGLSLIPLQPMNWREWWAFILGSWIGLAILKPLTMAFIISAQDEVDELKKKLDKHV